MYVLCKSVKKRPNILFAIADDMSFGHTSLDGYPEVNTPAFDKIANEGIYFQNAYCSAPSCSPSRAAILTGKNGYELEEGGVLWSYLPGKFLVYQDLLDQNGYLTGYTGKGWGPGDLEIANRYKNPAGKAYNDLKATPVMSCGKVSGISSIDYFSNFKQFLAQREDGQPFSFWFASYEPHRVYQEGVGKLVGKDPSKVLVPGFFPDTEEIRSDILDYLVEIEWYDMHLLKMMTYLDSIGELENTIVVMTSDNGMPFPRAKSNLYEYGAHMPLAIRWGNKLSRVVDDFISFVDFAPTFLEAAKVAIPETMSGKSFYDILLSKKSGQIDPERNTAIIYKERHAWVQPEGECTPVRAYRKDNWLVIWNLAPDMWPAGHPDPEINFNLWPFGDVDDGPSKTEVMKQKNKENVVDYFNMAFGKRPEFELYDIQKDPYQLSNLATNSQYTEILNLLINEMKGKLRATNDPRIVGIGIDHFENAPYFFSHAAGTGWVRPERWESFSKEEKEQHLITMHAKLEENRKKLNIIYGDPD